MSVKPITKDGKVFYSVADTAKLLGITKSKVQGLMAEDILQWAQTRLNGRLIVDAQSLARYQRSLDSLKLTKKSQQG